MKYLIIFLLTLTAYAQNDSVAPQNISVVSVENLNVVYRGLDNPIKIAVPGAVSFTATAPGLEPDDKKGPGNYIMNPPSGMEVTITIEAQIENNSVLTEYKKFRIMGLHGPQPMLNESDRDGTKMTKEQLYNSTLNFSNEYLLHLEAGVDYYATSFTILMPRNKKKRFGVVGNKIPSYLKDEIYRLKKGDEVIFTDIHIHHDYRLLYDKGVSLLIRIID